MLGRPLTIAALGGLLASGLAALPAQAGTDVLQARTAQADTGQRHDGNPSEAPLLARPAPHLPAAQRAMLLARERWLSAHGGGQRQAAGHDAGALTGVVRGADGRPVAGACVTATSPFGTVLAKSNANGHYLLPGLHAGRYTLRIASCADTSAVPSAFVWPQLPADVAVVAGQVHALPAVTAVPASGAAAATRSSAAGQAGTGAISGRVTGHGHPLKGICAGAERVGGGEGFGAVTATSGKYRINGLRPGRYQVQFTTGFGCVNTGNWLSQWYPGINTPFPSAKAAVIRVRAGRTRTGVDAQLKLGGEITGHVRTRSGSGVRGICVDVEGRIAGGFVGFELRSARGGRYVLHGLFPGRYTVGFSIGCGTKRNFAPQWWRLRTSGRHATPIMIKGTRLTRHIDAALDPGAAISGTIRAGSATGTPLAGICVEATDSHGDDFADAVSAKNGTYRLEGLAGGTYEVVFDPSCFGEGGSNYLPEQRTVSVGRGRTLAGVDANLQAGAGLSGLVTGPHGHPLQGVCVEVFGVHGLSFAESDFDGTYSVAGLRAGAYKVQFLGCDNSGSVAPQYYNGEQSESSADAVTLTAGQVTPNIDAAMKAGSTITGVVTDAAGNRLGNVCVGVANQSALNFEVFTDIEFTSRGRYRAQNLGPGLYQVEFGCGGGRYASHYYRTKPGLTPTTLISIGPGLTSGIDAVVRPGGAISGIITNRAGRRLSTACVSLVDANTGIQPVQAFDQGFADNGQYRIGGLAPGRYKVQFYGCGDQYASQWYRGRSTERKADPVVVRPGHTTAGIGGALSVGGTISGLVVAKATGKPVRNVCIDAFDARTQSSGFGQTGKAGRYTVRGLASGRYSLFFSLCGAKPANLITGARPGFVLVTAPHAVTGVNASLAPGGSVSGTVAAGSRPLSDICAELVPVLPSDNNFGFAFTRADGSYTATGLAAGQYDVYFDPTCGFEVPQYAGQWYNGQPNEATASTVTVSVGVTTSGIDATLGPFGSIEGTVTDPAHAPVAGECVTAVPAGKSGPPTQSPEVAISRPSGGYALAELQPGTYKVKFSSGCGDTGFATQWWQNAGSAAAATVITVGGGAVVSGIDAALKR